MLIFQTMTVCLDLKCTEAMSGWGEETSLGFCSDSQWEGYFLDRVLNTEDALSLEFENN